MDGNRTASLGALQRSAHTDVHAYKHAYTKTKPSVVIQLRIGHHFAIYKGKDNISTPEATHYQSLGNCGTVMGLLSPPKFFSA